MADMKLKYTIQPYQTEAVESVVDVFAGQPYRACGAYRRDLPVQKGLEHYSLLDEADALGYANAVLTLDQTQLLTNLNRVQARQNLHQSSALTTALGACSLDVEMETGTGKTYVYIKTMFELNRRYGWSKFIVVVPSIAIREGVSRSFETMQEHFMELYRKKVRSFIYNSKNLTDIDQFSQSADLCVMIINIQAFNARGKDARRIRTELDDFGTRRPIDVIRANRPILILDEPQKMGGTATQNSLKEFSPLFCLNYSATHKQHHELVYALDALDAYHKRLVKRIEVKGFEVKNLRGTDGYLCLEGIVLSPNKPPMARLELEVRYRKSINRETRLAVEGDSLFELSKGMEQYQGYQVSHVDPNTGTVSFSNGTKLRTGEITGDVSEADLRRVQIRETIRTHFEKERMLFPRGIKTLSLFFLDEVAKYRQYDPDGNELNSEYGTAFEREYADILEEYLAQGDTPYTQYLRRISPEKTHAGYFSIDKKGRKIDSALKRGSDQSDDISAYELILKDKERLLSFQSPVRFIFSHSALREGWDNPNVFQICALKHGGSSPTQTRQEVGRGLRLCVDQGGSRMDEAILGSQVQHINQLTVIASSGYQDFVSGLQQGIREDLCERPEKAVKEYFVGKRLTVDGVTVTVSEKQGGDIYRYLIKNEYVDEDDRVSDLYRAAWADGTLAPLPESCQPIAAGVHALIRNVFDPRALEGMIGNGGAATISENPLNENFQRAEFQALWTQLNHKYAYSVSIDSEALISDAAAHINERMFVTQLKYTVTTGQQEAHLSQETLKQGAGFTATETETHVLSRPAESQLRYDLVGKVARGANLTRKTAARILTGLQPHVFEMFLKNPEEFISKAVRLIQEKKAAQIVETIQYRQLEDCYDSSIFAMRGKRDFAQAYRAKRCVQDYVFPDGYAKDGQSVERRFVEDMDRSREVLVYAKLPKSFVIPTPVGDYTPDWAVVLRTDAGELLFLLVETKGTMDEPSLRPVESAKIHCAEALFRSLPHSDIQVVSVDSYQHLLDLVDQN